MTQPGFFGIVVILGPFLALLSAPLPADAQTNYYFVGPNGGDFFEASNWNTSPDGLGGQLRAGVLQDSSTNAIAVHLVIDGDSVIADGQVDFGTGSLSMESGSTLQVIGFGNDLDINSDSTFSLIAATLVVDDIVNFEGDAFFSGGVVVSLTDDIAFQDEFQDLTVNGTLFSAADNIYFDGFAGSIVNAVFDSGDRLGLRNNVSVEMSDTTLQIADGLGDLNDVFSTAGVGTSLTLRGVSHLRAESVGDGVRLILDESATATMGGLGSRIVDGSGSTIFLESTEATLRVLALDPQDALYQDPRPFLFNGQTGMSYADDPGAWNIPDWDGFSAQALRVVPEPGSLMMFGMGCLVLVRAGRGRP